MLTIIIELTENPGTVVNYSEPGYLPRHSQRLSALTLGIACTLTAANGVHGVKKPLSVTFADDYELNSASLYQEEHRYSSPQTHITLSASPVIQIYNPSPHYK